MAQAGHAEPDQLSRHKATLRLSQRSYDAAGCVKSQLACDSELLGNRCDHCKSAHLNTVREPAAGYAIQIQIYMESAPTSCANHRVCCDEGCD